MKLLILGGTGAMGGELTRLLTEAGHEVTVTSRTKHPSLYGEHFLVGNVKQIGFITEVCESYWDAIVDFMSYSTADFMQRKDLLLNSTNQYLFLSSARVYADLDNEKITESSPRLLDVCKDQDYLRTDEYALAKARQENLLMDSGKKNWTIIRPSLTYGKERLQLGVYEKENWLYRALHDRAIVFSKDLMDRYYTLSHGRDVAKGIAGLIGNNKAMGEAFHVVQAESVQWRKVLDIYTTVLEDSLGKKPKVILTEKCTNLQIPNARYQVIYGRYFSRHFDNGKIKGIVNTSDWIRPEEGLKECLTAFLMKPRFRDIDWTIEALIDRAAQEWTPITEVKGRRNKIQYVKRRIIGA